MSEFYSEAEAREIIRQSVVDEKLIEEARVAFTEAWEAEDKRAGLRVLAREPVRPHSRSRAGIVAALAVFEKAHTSTDDEREALLELLGPILHLPISVIRDNILAAGFRRFEAPEPSADDSMSHYADPTDPFWQSNPEPHGEPSDAPESDLIAWHVEQVEALRPFTRSSHHLKAAMMHAATVRALRAALSLREGGVR